MKECGEGGGRIVVDEVDEEEEEEEEEGGRTVVCVRKEGCELKVRVGEGGVME